MRQKNKIYEGDRAALLRGIEWTAMEKMKGPLLGFCWLRWKGWHERKGCRILLLDLGRSKGSIKRDETKWDLEEEETAFANANLFICLYIDTRVCVYIY